MQFNIVKINIILHFSKFCFSACKVNILLKNVESLRLLTDDLSEWEKEPVPLSQQLRITLQMMMLLSGRTRPS